MAQLITIILLVVGSVILYRRFVRDAEKLSAKSKRREKERETGAIGTLIKDPETGEYRVKREDET
ncbi:NfeD family protein [Agrobacterium leguminum]|jgi:membrane protein implicated in regulation of membrane protease activity|uniref:NfeD family protein n=1 Tax=Agrobacterium leguminum TaxID=2792015 RepID=UPI003CE51CC5